MSSHGAPRAARLVPLVAFVLLAALVAPAGSAQTGAGFGVTLGLDAPDITVPLQSLGGAAICYIDANGDGAYAPGDPVILRTSGGCSGQSSGRDVRLARWEGLEPGERLGSARDANKPLSAPASGASFWYYDANGNGRLDAGDTAYANIVNGLTGFVDVGDVRVAPFGELPAGSVVASGEPDLSLGLTLLGQPSQAVGVADLDGDATLDSGESLYLDADLGGGTLVTYHDLRITPIDAARPYGSFVRFGEADGSAFYTSVQRSPCLTDADGSGGPSVGDGLYLDRDGDCLGSVALGDVRLVAGAGFDAGTRVSPGDEDVGRAYLRVEDARIGYVDQDGDARYGASDVVFVDLVQPDAHRMDRGDVRLSPAGTTPGGGVIDTDHPDLGRTVSDLGLFSAAVAFVPVSGGAVPSATDPIYLNMKWQGQEGVAPGDIRLAPLRSLPFGGAATMGTQEVLPRLARGGGMFCVATTDPAQYKAGDAVYLSFQGCASQLSVGALRLVPPSTFAAGSVVGATDGDVGAGISGANGQQWRFFDADGDNEWSAGDTLYADLVNPAANRVDVGDLRITPIAGLSSGAPVRGQDPDVALPVVTLGGAGSHTAFVDGVDDGVFARGDVPYVDADGSGLYVAPLDVRLTSLPEPPAVEPTSSPSPSPTETLPPDDAPTPSPTEDTPTPSQTLTGGPGPSDTPGDDPPRTPGPAMALVLAAVAAMLWLARRR